MIRSFLSLFFFIGLAFAEAPFEARVAEAVRDAALLPDAADVRVTSVTPVRGAVERIDITRFDRRTGQFDAIIAHGSREARISGRVAVKTPVVVATSTLRRDHEIQAGDIELRYVSIAQVPATAFLSLDEVLGTAVRRSLPAGRPVRQEDVGPPIVLRKNAAIRIVYETAGMTLETSGRALEDGAVGDSVRIVSDGQGNIVLGEVAGPDRVVVR